MMLAESDDAVNWQQPKDEAPSNGFAILLRVNLTTAGEAREPDADRDCSNRLLERFGDTARQFLP